MGMVHKGGNAVPFHGDHHPVGIYVGDQPIFEPIDQVQDGKTITFENTYNDTAEVTVFGESTQETLSGKNLFDIYDKHPSHWDSGVSVDEDGWTTVKITGKGTGYTFANFWTKTSNNLNTETNYTAVIEIKSIDSGVILTPVGSNNLNLPIQLRVDGSKATYTESGTFTMKLVSVSDFSNATTMARGYAHTSGGASGTVVFRMSIVPYDESITAENFVYEPYCGGIPSPNPDYPQPIESVKSVELLSRGRNLLEYTDTFDINNYYKSNGSVILGEVFQNVLGKLSAVKTKRAWFGAGFDPTSVFERCNVKPGDLLTYSVLFMCDFAPIKIMPFTLYRSDANNGLGNCVAHGSTAKIYKYTKQTMYVDYSDIQPGKWYKLWYTFVVPDDWSGTRNTRIETDYYTTSDYMFGTNGESIYFAGLMLEKGSKPHEFEPYRYSSRTIDLQGHELRSLPDGTRDELLVHRDGTVELVLRCDASMFDQSHPISNEWKLATPQNIQLPSIDPLPTYHQYTFVDGNGADISAHVRVFLGPTSKMIEDGGE